MALLTKIPVTFEATRGLLEQQSKILGVLSRNSQGTRRRPQAPRNIIAQSASLGAVITWNQPVKAKGIVGFRIYKDNENNLLEEIRDASRKQYRLALPAGSTTCMFISSITQQGAESPKMPIFVSSTADQLVTSGTGGGTNGSQPTPPPNWTSEPTGGSFVGNKRNVFL